MLWGTSSLEKIPRIKEVELGGHACRLTWVSSVGSWAFCCPFLPFTFSFPFGFPGLSALGFPDLIADRSTFLSGLQDRLEMFLMELYFKKVTTTGGKKSKPKSLEKARERFLERHEFT